MKRYILGAQAIACSIYHAWNTLFPDKPIEGFLATDPSRNPAEVAGVSVLGIRPFADQQSAAEKEQTAILLGMPQNVQADAERELHALGYKHVETFPSERENQLLHDYYQREGIFPALHDMPEGQATARVAVYAVRSAKDKPMQSAPVYPPFVHSLFLGEPKSGKAEFFDSTGENISDRNASFCEMTGLYWIWKNRLRMDTDYVGLYHYRRFLDIREDDFARLKQNAVDIVLPYPLLHDPDSFSHHRRYMTDEEWSVLDETLRELSPEMAAQMGRVFAEPYFYNYNMFLARKDVLDAYAGWLFPILFETERKLHERNLNQTKRALAYMSESLFTLYFRAHADRLRIAHVGRRMYV